MVLTPTLKLTPGELVQGHDQHPQYAPRRFPGSLRLFKDVFFFTVLMISIRNSAVQLSNSRQKENEISTEEMD